jgi:hypothetical protein
MSSKPGCLKPVLMGCLGLIIIIVLGLGVMAGIAWRGVSKQDVQEQIREGAVEVLSGAAPADAPSRTYPAGRVILDLGQGEFHVHRGEPDTGVRVKARFDQNSHELVDELETLPDGTWVYRVSYRQTIPMMQAFMQALMGADTESRVDVYLPPDAPVALELNQREGGAELELGGLWLTELVIDAVRGGCAVSAAEPLREPAERVVIGGSMGGIEVVGVGNLSPRVLQVSWHMGGAEIDLSGQWRRSCDIDARIKMGGLALVAPADVPLREVADDAPLGGVEPEAGAIELRLRRSADRGEIDIVRR